jgi:MoaA/NifB/PqqE/SkfB family radical SAM enzyme
VRGSKRRISAIFANQRMPNFVLPAVCDVSVTNVCNAACDFCGFARDKTLAGPARYVDADAFARALPILHRRGIRYITLQGGEPLVHRDIVRLVSETAAAGISCAIITNGWFLPRYIESLLVAGLSRLIVSIDSANLAEHERNRGLEGLERRLVEGIAQARAGGLSVQASVTVNRLICYDELPDTLRRLGFDCVSFSYPRREPFGSTSLVARTVQCLHDGLLPQRQHSDARRGRGHGCGRAFAAGQIGSAVSSLFRRSVAQSLWTLIEQTPQMRRLARRRKQIAAASHAEIG